MHEIMSWIFECDWSANDHFVFIQIYEAVYAFNAGAQADTYYVIYKKK